jgi:hypothetical protein
MENQRFSSLLDEIVKDARVAKEVSCLTLGESVFTQKKGSNPLLTVLIPSSFLLKYILFTSGPDGILLINQYSKVR